jgi:hypothetical protein
LRLQVEQRDGFVGYRYANLYRDGKMRHTSVHTIVLEAFVGPRPDGLVARHGPLKYEDGTPDNRLSNLEWGTPSENAMDRLRE